MRMAIISSKEVHSEGRMDAKFHVIKHSLETDGSLGRARSAILALLDPGIPESEEEAAISAKSKEVMEALPSAVRSRSVERLARGTIDHTSNIMKAIQEYPLMAVAIAFRDEEADLLLQRKIDELQQKLDKISGLGHAIRKPGM